MGYAACAAARAGLVEEGSVGAGTGATVGKLYGIERAMRGGLGVSSVERDGVVTAALMLITLPALLMILPSTPAAARDSRIRDSFCSHDWRDGKREIKRLNLPTKIIFLSIQKDRDYIEASLEQIGRSLAVCGRAANDDGPSPRLAADAANRLGLTTHVGQQARVCRAPQPLLDQSPKDNLQAHGKSHGGRRASREHPGAVDETTR
jgi:hypothetical protein